MSHRRRGFALISTFMFLGMLFMMAVSMILMSRQRIFAGMSQHHQTQALYLAEAGLAKAQVALENDLSWSGVTDATIPGMRGTYTVTFGTGKYDSVNNIGGLTPKPSYRGPNSVPQNSALLIVTSNVSGHRYTLEALVEGNGSVGYVTDAILGSGKIVMQGDLYVDGITALDDSSEVSGSIQSNASAGSNLVSWNGPGTALVTGNVGTQGSSASAISMSGATIQGSLELNSSTVIPSYDVANKVTANYSAGTPVTIVPFGTTTLPAGKHSYSGPAIDGDIVLADGAELYVQGDLSINGTVRGNGSVYVNGKTTLKGDSEVTTNPDYSVSLYSEGSVVLTGFDGTEFMDNQGGQIQADLKNAEAHLKYLQQELSDNGNVLNAYTADRVTTVLVNLGLHDSGTPAQIIPGLLLEDGTPVTPKKNLMYELRDQIDSLPASESKTFLSNRLSKLEDLFKSANLADTVAPDPNLALMNNFEATGETKGLLDSVAAVYSVDHSKPSPPPRFEQAKKLWPNVVNLINSVTYDKIGSSYFQGAIYTQGSFVANNEVQVLGAIIVNGQGTTAETFTLKDVNNNSTTVTLKPGDIYLGKSTRVTYVEEMFKGNPSTPSIGPQLLSKNLWMGR
ncbi:MAG TPA: hypothetical protein EYO33_02950 [Phycisphaerales bacterium]|nr:hypothetical protein [Phycisphaerales bacterium]